MDFLDLLNDERAKVKTSFCFWSFSLVEDPLHALQRPCIQQYLFSTLQVPCVSCKQLKTSWIKLCDFKKACIFWSGKLMARIDVSKNVPFKWHCHLWAAPLTLRGLNLITFSHLWSFDILYPKKNIKAQVALKPSMNLMQFFHYWPHGSLHVKRKEHAAFTLDALFPFLWSFEA